MALKRYWYHILVALSESPCHGAEIQRRVEEHSEGTITLYPAMLYGSLEDLAHKGLIRAVKPPTAESNLRSRHYALSSAGRITLAEETSRLEGLLRVARRGLRRGSKA